MRAVAHKRLSKSVSVYVSSELLLGDEMRAVAHKRLEEENVCMSVCTYVNSVYVCVYVRSQVCIYVCTHACIPRGAASRTRPARAARGMIARRRGPCAPVNGAHRM